jgi:hypothetical protein
MSIKRIIIIVVLLCLLVSCNAPKKEATPTENTKTQVVNALQETHDVETQVAEALTQTALAQAPAAATNTPLPVGDTPIWTGTAVFTSTPVFTFTLPPASSTNTPPPSPTSNASPTPCYVVLDDWCLGHAGCSTMTITNKTNDNATILLKNTQYGVNVTFKVPPSSTNGACTMELRPGSYYYEFTYCGKFNSGNHALNDNWKITFKC